MLATMGRHESEGRGTRIKPHLKGGGYQRTQDRGHRIVGRVDERHEDCESRPADDARLADYVGHLWDHLRGIPNDERLVQVSKSTCYIAHSRPEVGKGPRTRAVAALITPVFARMSA